MATSITPHVVSSEEILQYPQITESVSDVVMIPIISKRGQITPTLVNNRQLLNLFVGSEGIVRSDNISLKTAYAISQVTQIMVCRVTQVDVMPAVAVGNTITKCYVKDNVAYQDVECETELDTSTIAFVVHVNSPMDEDGFEIEIVSAYTPGSDANVTGTIRLSDGVDVNDSYPFSMNPDAINGYGESTYVETINDYQNVFVITPYNNIAVSTGNSTFGAVEGYDTSELNKFEANGLISETVAGYVSEAINKMSKYRRDIRLDCIYDGGLIHKDIIETIESVARKRKTLGVFSAPIVANTFTKLKSFYNGDIKNLLNTSAKQSSYLYSACPARSDTTLFGWKEIIPYSLYYILRIYTNSASNMKYAPVFGKQTGLVEGSGIQVTLEHSTDAEEIALEDNDPNLPETEALQRLSANPVVYDQSLGTAYFVNNLTFQTPNLNQLSEENNRRLFNRIQFDINKLLENIISRANNQITRDELADMLDNYKTGTLDYLGYTVKGFRYDIKPFNAGKRNWLGLTVEVSFEDSVKYVQVLYRNIPVMNS